MRQIVLDTETTGLEPSEGHRIIEIGGVELVNRRPTGGSFHRYLQPDREIDEGALGVHGISSEFLADKARFADLVEELLAFLRETELVIHNAPFDVGFLNHELSLLGPEWGRIEDYASVSDSLLIARERHPGQRNSLDALCRRYQVDNAERDLHGALLDAQLLAEVYLAMTGGQTSLSLAGAADQGWDGDDRGIRRLSSDRPPLPVVHADADELEAHQRILREIDESSGHCLWPRE